MRYRVRTLDSAQNADARREELRIPREVARDLGLSALDAIRRGRYRHEGRDVDWSDAVDLALERKRSLPPDAPLPEPSGGPELELLVEVANETTLGVARRLVDAGERPLALNVANGIEPGSGFLDGARAQETASRWHPSRIASSRPVHRRKGAIATTSDSVVPALAV